MSVHYNHCLSVDNHRANEPVPCARCRLASFTATGRTGPSSPGQASQPLRPFISMRVPTIPCEAIVPDDKDVCLSLGLWPAICTAYERPSLNVGETHTSGRKASRCSKGIMHARTHARTHAPARQDGRAFLVQRRGSGRWLHTAARGGRKRASKCDMASCCSCSFGESGDAAVIAQAITAAVFLAAVRAATSYCTRRRPGCRGRAWTERRYLVHPGRTGVARSAAADPSHSGGGGGGRGEGRLEG
ncbi:hypothetical protein BC628DRAFT_903229 [Trametes gibbosa]|nr:hypothetical protein BC628DRAFT_903229 [Trametes gibbosa]